jgi:hypothetical protein
MGNPIFEVTLNVKRDTDIGRSNIYKYLRVLNLLKSTVYIRA